MQAPPLLRHAGGGGQGGAADDEAVAASMPFEDMCQALEEWSCRFHSCLVPRHCHDAPELGAWVRCMRRLRGKGALEKWKVHRLNRLGFQWVVSKQEALWHGNLHHLRHYQALHGQQALPEGGRSDSEPAWCALAAWVRAQSELLVAGKLPQAQVRALAAVGVTLAVGPEPARRQVRLQGLNAHERKRARKQWKLADQASEQQRGRETEPEAAGPEEGKPQGQRTRTDPAARAR
jgi:hypothetical protein